MGQNTDVHIKKHTLFTGIDWIKLSKRQVPPPINITEIVRIVKAVYGNRPMYKFKFRNKDRLKVRGYARDDLLSRKSKLWRQHNLNNAASNLFP